MINGNPFDECQMFGIVFKSIYCVIVATFVMIKVIWLHNHKDVYEYIKSQFSVRDSVAGAQYLLGLWTHDVCVCVCRYDEYINLLEYPIRQG